MSPTDRALIGRPALTRPERQEKAGIAQERDLHKLIWNELLRREIFAIHSRMDKRTTNAVGTPDFCMAINGRPVAMEVKLPGNTLSDDQEKVRSRMIRNGWLYFVVFSFDEAISAIESLA